MKDVFLELIKEPFDQTFTEATILAAFRSTGLEPINASAVLPTQLAPSEEHSAPSAFPLELPAPVNAMMPLLRAVQSHPLDTTTEDLQTAALETAQLLRQSSAAFTVGPPSEVNAASILPEPIIQHPAHSSPSHTAPVSAAQHAGDTETLKSELTRYRATIEDLQKQNRTCRDIIDAQNCTIALQAVGFEAQRRKLSEKEVRKESNRDKLLATKVGRHLSGDEFRAAVRADDEEREKAKRKRTTAQAMRKERADRRKAKTDWRRAEQAARKAQRDRELEEWKAECAQCRGMRIRQPKKPRAPKKAPTPVRFQTPSEEEADKENAEDEEDEAGNGAVTDSD